MWCVERECVCVLWWCVWGCDLCGERVVWCVWVYLYSERCVREEVVCE